MAKPIILLVEDNPDDEALTRRAILKNDIQCDIEVKKDGVEALSYLLGQGIEPTRKPVFILLDLKLPKINGLEVLRQLRNDQRTKNIPVIIMTSSKEELDLHNAYSNGANSFITKPVDYNEFVESIGLLIRYWLEVNVPPPQ